MRQLLLLRHAKASSDDPSMPDHARPLTSRGRQAAEAMRDAMRLLDLRVDLVLVSSARRTLQTLQALAPWVAPSAVEPMDALYLASAPGMLHVLRQVTPTMHNVLLIAHNPGIHDLAMLLARDVLRSTAPGAARLYESYPTTGLTQLRIAGSWDTIEAGEAELVRFLTPAGLPQSRPPDPASP